MFLNENEKPQKYNFKNIYLQKKYMKLLRKFGIGMEKEILSRVNQINSDILDEKIGVDKYRKEIVSMVHEIKSQKSLKISRRKRIKLLAVLLKSISSTVLEGDKEFKRETELFLNYIAMYGKTVGFKLLRSQINASLYSLNLLAQIAEEHEDKWLGEQAVREAKEIIEVLDRRIKLYATHTTGMVRGMVIGGIALIPSYLLFTSTVTDLIKPMLITGIMLNTYLAIRKDYIKKSKEKRQNIGIDITQLDFQISKTNEEVKA